MTPAFVLRYNRTTMRPDKPSRAKARIIRLRSFLAVCAVFIFFLPFFFLKSVPSGMVILFYLAFTSVSVWLFLRYSSGLRDVSFESEALQERINLVNDSILKQKREIDSARGRAVLYGELKTIVEKVNNDLGLDSVAHNLTSVAFELIGGRRGTCSLYLADQYSRRLNLFKTRKEDKKTVVKEKEGDIFDLWVMRHSGNLLVEDTRSDFRFDMEKAAAGLSRRVRSLISAPLASDSSFLGILRLDNPEPGRYTQEDLRFLSVICSIGAVAIENSMLFQRTKEFAIHDGLTGLYTKGYLLERLREEMRRSVRRKNSYFSLLMVDIDHFKKYNDNFGHIAGDIVLKNLSRLLGEALGEFSPVISRFGGEEFCVILPDTDKKKGARLAEELRSEVAGSRICLRQQEERMTISIGVAAFPTDAGYEDELIIKADKAMYEAKNGGRNKVVTA